MFEAKPENITDVGAIPSSVARRKNSNAVTYSESRLVASKVIVKKTTAATCIMAGDMPAGGGVK